MLVATKAGASKVKGAAERISNLNLLPYAPRNQLAYANVDVVPYNVVNGAGLRNQLGSMAKVESIGGPHEWWNIHPAKYPNEHQAGIHGKGAPSGKLFPRR